VYKVFGVFEGILMHFIHKTLLKIFLLPWAVIIPKMKQLSPVAKYASVKFREAKIRNCFSIKE